MKTIVLDDWTIMALVDDDGHLNIYVTNSEVENIYEVETGQGDGIGEQMAVRFTTDKIEEEYNVEDQHFEDNSNYLRSLGV